MEVASRYLSRDCSSLDGLGIFQMMLVSCQSRQQVEVPQAETKKTVPQAETKKTKDEDAKVVEVLDNCYQFQERENQGVSVWFLGPN